MGIDFAGPVIVKTDAVTQGNSKVWLCLYTFCVVRAVDVDILFDLSVQSFIRSLRGLLHVGSSKETRFGQWENVHSCSKGIKSHFGE